MNHPDYIRRLLPLLHASAELHRIEGIVGMTPGELATYRVKVQLAEKAIADLYAFQLEIAHIPEVNSLLETRNTRFPSDDIDPKHN